MHNCPRKPTRFPFIAVFPKNLRDLFRALRIQQRRRGDRLTRVHAHIKRSIILKTESALRDVQLRRTHTQIQQHRIEPQTGIGLVLVPFLAGAPSAAPEAAARGDYSRRVALEAIAGSPGAGAAGARGSPSSFTL